MKNKSQIILTEEEKKFILERRKETENKKPKKIGFLKEDLFFVVDWRFIFSSTLFNKQEKEQEIKKFTDKFELIAKSGTKFICLIEDGKEFWFDDENIGIEEMTQEWAESYLIKEK